MATFTTPSGAVVDSVTGATISGPTGTNGVAAPAAPASNTDFTQQLQQKLLGQSGIISSDSTQLESKINAAITNVNKSADASGQAITSNYNRQEDYAKTAGANQLTSAQEAQRGFATNTAALKQLTDNTTKQVNDLEQRKQELILQGEASAASQVSQLQMQAIQFHQQAQQQVFTNLLGMGNFGLQSQQVQNSTNTQQLQQQQAMSDIALKYGLTPGPNETLQSLYSRATTDMGANSPAALAIKQAQSQIQTNNAQTAKAYADIETNKNNPLDAASITALGAEWNRNPANILQTVKNSGQLGQIVQAAATQQSSNMTIAINQDKTAGIDKATAIQKLTSNSNLSASQQADGLAKIEATYGPDSEQPAQGSPATLPGIASGYNNLFKNVDAGLINFLSGQKVTDKQGTTYGYLK